MTKKTNVKHEIIYKEDVQKIATLDALFPTMRVNSDSENQQTHKRKSDVYEITYQKDVMIKTYRENRKSNVHENTYQGDVMGKTYQEDVQDKA